MNYQLTSSAGEYFKATVDGEKTRTYTINHLQPDTAYDIKLQSYRTSGASDFSAVLQQKTLRKYHILLSVQSIKLYEIPKLCSKEIKTITSEEQGGAFIIYKSPMSQILSRNA